MEKYELTEITRILCESEENIIKFSYECEENDIFIEAFLNPNLNLKNRFKLGLKHLFNYRCKYGVFDCFIITKDISNILKKAITLSVHCNDINTNNISVSDTEFFGCQCFNDDHLLKLNYDGKMYANFIINNEKFFITRLYYFIRYILNLNKNLKKPEHYDFYFKREDLGRLEMMLNKIK
jgi:hypothetical protein